MEYGTYKLEKESVFSQSSNAPSKSQDEHHSSHHEEEPNRVKAAEIGDGRDVGQNSLLDRTHNRALGGRVSFPASKDDRHGLSPPHPRKNFTGDLITSHHGKKHYQVDREKKRKREEKLLSFQGLDGFIFLVKLYKAKT